MNRIDAFIETQLPSEPPNDTAQTEEVVRPASSAPIQDSPAAAQTADITTAGESGLDSATHGIPDSLTQRTGPEEILCRNCGLSIAKILDPWGGEHGWHHPSIEREVNIDGADVMTHATMCPDDLGEAEPFIDLAAQIDHLGETMNARLREYQQMLSALEAVELWFYDANVSTGAAERELLDKVRAAIRMGRS